MTIFIDSNSVSQIDSYTGLIDGVGNWLDRSDLNDRIPDFIRLAEARFRRVLVMPDMETQVTFVPTAGAPAPVDMDSVLSLTLLGNRPLEQLAAASFYALPQAMGTPSRYALLAGNIVTWPAPDTDYTALLTYRAMLPALGSLSTNWLLSAHPDAYLYASIIEAEGYLTNDERIPNIKALLDEKLDEIMMAGQRKRYGGGPIVMRPAVREGLCYRGYR